MIGDRARSLAIKRKSKKMRLFSESSTLKCEDKKDRLKPHQGILSRYLTIRRFPIIFKTL